MAGVDSTSSSLGKEGVSSTDGAEPEIKLNEMRYLYPAHLTNQQQKEDS